MSRGGGTSAISASAASIRYRGLDVRAGGAAAQPGQLLAREVLPARLGRVGLPGALGPGVDPVGVAAVVALARARRRPPRSGCRPRRGTTGRGSRPRPRTAGRCRCSASQPMPSTSRWFVGSSRTTQVGVADQRRRRARPALLAAGEPVDAPVQVAQTQPVEHVAHLRSAAHSCSASYRDSTTSRTRAPGGSRRPARRAPVSPPTWLTRPRLRLATAGEDVEQRGLAAAVEADDADPLAALDAERDRVEQHPRRVAGTCAVTDSRLTRFCAHRRIRRAPADARRAGGSSGSTSRAPGTGPCATRTVRHTPTPASWAATSTALSASAHRNAQVGPEPETIAGRARRRRRPARRVRRSSGCSDTAAACRSLPSAERELARVAARARLEHRLDRADRGRAARASRAAGPARRRRAGVDRPAAVSASTQCCGCRASTGTICSPRPVPSAVPP